jgi:hypothetical protein
MALKLAILAIALARVSADKASFDCIARNLAVEFAAFANPSVSTAQLQEVADALIGSATSPCNITIPAELAAKHAQPRFRPFSIKPQAAIFYVSKSTSQLYGIRHHRLQIFKNDVRLLLC